MCSLTVKVKFCSHYNCHLPNEFVISYVTLLVVVLVLPGVDCCKKVTGDDDEKIGTSKLSVLALEE